MENFLVVWVPKILLAGIITALAIGFILAALEIIGGALIMIYAAFWAFPKMLIENIYWVISTGYKEVKKGLARKSRKKKYVR